MSRSAAILLCSHLSACVQALPHPDLAPAPPMARTMLMRLAFEGLDARPDDRSKTFVRELPRAMRAALLDAGYRITVAPEVGEHVTLRFTSDIALQGSQFSLPSAEVTVEVVTVPSGPPIERFEWRALRRFGLAVHREAEIAAQAATLLANALGASRLMSRGRPDRVPN